ncbi:hypothetical protein PG997_008640 [Apiospora hydei]|uniref:Complex 1 LYR protein domain-containing protein n=1 Tax=Apiospora hydei TaxID=1337664 RepID=A0ABR1WBF4_9PEZI
MPPQLPHPDTTIHLYRHLLREATYVPPYCRPWVTERIRSKFRDDRRPNIHKAHQSLRYLRSANAGHVNRMLHLCFLASGRLGKRRRQLADFYLAKDPVQMRKTYDPALVLPKENVWGRPFTPKVMRRKEQKHYAKLLADLMPPVPQGEWDLLQALSLGQAETDMFNVPSRRTVATTPVASQDSATNTAQEWNWEAYVTKPVRAVERGNSRVFKSLSGACDSDPRGQGKPIGVKAFSPRRLRRSIYGRVWEASPILTKTKGKFQVTFGGARRELSPATNSDLQFFSGVDEQGASPKGPVAHKGNKRLNQAL